MNGPLINSIFLVLAAACFVPTLVSLFLISRFYELKFGQRTHHRVFLGAAVAYAILLVVAAAGFFTYECLTLANGLALLVIFVYGLRLYRMMTGVTK